MNQDRLVTVAIHTYQKAQMIKMLLESQDIEVHLHNVNLIQPVVSSGVRVRIKESDLPRALDIIENSELYKEEVTENKKPVILIPVDFSEYSERACRIGFNHAKAIGAEVVLLHVFFIPVFPRGIMLDNLMPYQTVDEETSLTLQKNVQHKMDHFEKSVRKSIKSGDYPEVPFTCILQYGLPEDEILSYAKEHKPTLIIMGTRGSGKKDIDLIGSVTAEVIEQAKVPVLTIPEETTLQDLADVKRIAFGMQFEHRDLVVFEKLYKFFEHKPVQFYLFHLEHEKGDVWDEIKLGGVKEYFTKQYPDAVIHNEIIDANDFSVSLDRFLQKNRIDIVALPTYSRNIFSRLFNQSVARKMLFHTNTPILAMRF